MAVACPFAYNLSKIKAMKSRVPLRVGIFLSVWLGACSSGRIPCPDVSGNKSGLFGLFKKSEPTPEDQANEGRDLGGRDMDYDRGGLLKKKTVKLPTNRKKMRIVTKQGMVKKKSKLLHREK